MTPETTSTPDRRPVWPCELVAAMAGDEMLELFVVTREGRHPRFEELEAFLARRKEERC